MTGMYMGVDEARDHQFRACGDDLVDVAREVLSDEENSGSFVDQLRVAPQHMTGS